MLIFNTFYQENPDYNASDSLEESGRLIQRQRAIKQCVDGNLDAETLLDMLAEHGIDVDLYVEEVEENVETVINQGLILLPEYV